jgi:hypothetical protein
MAALWLIAAALAATTSPTGNGAVDAFVADIAAGRRDAALARIWEMNSLSGRPNAVGLADEFVDSLLRCTVESVQTRNFGGPMYDVLWRCPDGGYFSLLDGDYHAPRIVVGEFVSAGERERRRQDRLVPAPYVPVAPAPAPAPTVEERRQIVARYVAALRLSEGATPGPPIVLVRFADGRPDAFIGIEQLRNYLLPCREASLETNEAGALVHWTCTGARALNPDMTMQVNLSGARITGNFVEVGALPNSPTVGSPH